MCLIIFPMHYNSHTAAKYSPQSNRDKPMPVPRKTQQHQQAVEESIYDLPGDLLHSNDDTQQAHVYDQPRKLAPVCVMHDDYKNV